MWIKWLLANAKWYGGLWPCSCTHVEMLLLKRASPLPCQGLRHLVNPGVCVFLCFVSSCSLKMSAMFVVFPMERGTQQESDVGGNVAVVGRKIKVSKT